MNSPYETIIKQPITGNFPLPPFGNDLWIVGGIADTLEESKIKCVAEALSKKGYTLRRFQDVLGDISVKSLSYYFPGDTPSLDELNRDNFNNTVFDGLGIVSSGQETLAIRYVGKPDPLYVDGDASLFSAWKFMQCDEISFVDSLLEYFGTLEDISGENILLRKRIIQRSEPLTPEELFDEEMLRVAEETRKGLEKLVLSGYSLDIIEGWLKTIVKPSRLVITEMFDILLPDYNNMVIEMRQLPKALFLFFLKHENGFAIYQMQNHRDEILAIYDRITNSSESDTIEKRIDDLVAPDGKSFIEKCSAIKKAFTEKMSDRIAQHYYIHGPQGYAKRISLDRSLVEWKVSV